MKLQELPSVQHLDFDLESRKLIVYHQQAASIVAETLHELSLGEELLSTEDSTDFQIDDSHDQRTTLWYVLGINAAFFLIEMSTGLISGSMGLVADSLDMLADSIVYSLSLFAVGGSLIKKKRIATLAGYAQILLAITGFAEIIRRFISSESPPDFTTMIIVSALALIANTLCLYLLQKLKSKDEAHMKASMIFTSNDIIINSGVIVAGILVRLFDSALPDLLIGTIVFAVVVRGAFRILKLGR